jgi:hypothetical protein
MAIVEAINIPIGVTGTETVQQAANSYEDLGDAVAKTQLEAERLAQQFGINDQRTQEAIKVAGRYKQEMEQLDFAIDGARGGVDTLFRATQGVVAGFEVAVGAAALFGTESEQLEKVLMKVQGAMVLSQGLKDLKEFAPAMRQATTATLNWVKSLRLARVALAGLGIGAIIILFQTFSDKLSGIVNFFKDLTDSLGLTNFAQEKLIKTQEGAIKTLERELAVMEAKGESEDKLFAKRLEIAKAEEKLAKDRLEFLKEGDDGYQDAFQAAEDATNNIKVLQKTEDKRLNDRYKERLKAQAEFKQNMFALQVQEIIDNRKRLEDIADLERVYQAESKNDIEENRLLRQIQLDKQFKEEREMLENARIMGLLTDEKYQELSIKQNDNHKKKLLESDREYRQAKRDLEEKSATELSQMLLDLNNVFQGQKEDQSRQEFERDKAFSIAQTLISTYFAAQRAYTSQLTATPDSPIRAAIAAAAAVTSGLARVASIRRVRYDDPNADKGSSGANATGQAIPRFQAPTTRLPQTDEFTQVRRVYVTERDITNVQDKVRVTESLSQF